MRCACRYRFSKITTAGYWKECQVSRPWNATSRFCNAGVTDAQRTSAREYQTLCLDSIIDI